MIKVGRNIKIYIPPNLLRGISRASGEGHLERRYLFSIDVLMSYKEGSNFPLRNVFLALRKLHQILCQLSSLI